jgi:uncharacterized protein (DUF2267 family)
MDRRWEQRRAQASARRADETVSAVIRREPPPSAASELTAELPSTPHLLDDLQQLEHGTAARGGTSFLRNTRRAMLLVVLVSNSVLFALLYANGFLG